MSTTNAPIGLALVALVLSTALSTDATAIDGAGIRSFTVESDPAGAEVVTITGRHGTTPVTLDERDLFPNRYPPEKVDKYGVVTLRRDGCRELNIRPGEEDIVRGLSLELVCGQNAASDPVQTSARPDNGQPAPPAQRATAPESDDPDRASKKLEQLRFLQELLEEGLITPEEEAIIRRRILRQP